MIVHVPQWGQEAHYRFVMVFSTFGVRVCVCVGVWERVWYQCGQVGMQQSIMRVATVEEAIWGNYAL